MKSASSPLIALLATRQFNYASLFEFDLIGGGKLYYTNCDTPIVSGGTTYITPKQSGVIIDRKGARAKVKWRVGVEVDTLTFDVLPNSGTVNGQDFLAAVGQGVFDGANCIFYTKVL